VTTPTAHLEVTQERNTQAPIVAWIRALHDRLLRAEILASAGKVHPVVDMPDAYIVEGTKGPYLVKEGKCPCPDAANRNGLTDGNCKHLLAALLYGQEVTPTETTESTPVTRQPIRSWKRR
jgi:hypothetical protein